MSNATIQLQATVNLASTHADLLPLAGVGGYTDQPALDLCNDTIQELLSAPFEWKFNRVEMGMLVTSQNKQDYLHAGATAFTVNGGVGIDLSSNDAITQSGTTTTVVTLEDHNFNVGDVVYLWNCDVANYNAILTKTPSAWTYSNGWTITSIPTPTSFVFTATAGSWGASGAAGIFDYGWMESASMIDINNNSPLKAPRILKAVRTIQPCPTVSNPTKISVVSDLGTGVLQIRFYVVPGSTVWGALPIYQAKAPLKADLTNSWAPFPDEFGFVYRQAFLARCYRYINSPRAEIEDQKAQRAILKALGRDDAEQSDEFIAPERSLLQF